MFIRVFLFSKRGKHEGTKDRDDKVKGLMITVCETVYEEE